MMIFIPAVAILFSCGLQPAPIVEPIVRTPTWDRMPNAEVIARLPEAGEELVFDEQTLAWTEHPASVELRARIQRDGLSDDEWVAALNASRVLVFHESWLRERPLKVSLRAPLWLGSFGHVRVKPRAPGGLEVDQCVIWGGCGLANEYERYRREHLEVGPAPTKSGPVVFDVEIEANALYGRGLSRERTVRWRGTIERPLRLVDGEAEAVQAVVDPSLDRAVRSALSATVGKNSGKPPRIALWINVSRVPALEPYLLTHAVRANVEILDAGAVVDEFVVDFNDAPRQPGTRPYNRDGFTEAYLKDPAVLDHLSVRVTGSAAVAFDNLRRNTCWAGSFEVPLRDLLADRP